MNSNQKSSENRNFPLNISDNRQIVLNRLNERHTQSQVVNSQRKNIDSFGNGNIHEKFLQHFIQYKLAIVTDLEDMTKKIQGNDLPINERTQSLNDLFQEKRTELLPNKKFGFSRQQTTKKQENENKSESHPESSICKSSSIVTPNNNDSVIYDERFSLINITGPKHFIIPNINCSSDSFISQTVYLIDLIDCTIEICHVFGSLIGRRLKNCKIYAYPISGSVWLDECINCDLVFACRQLRIHQTSNCRLGLHMASRPIIEQCTNLKVAPYQLVYKSLEQDLSTAGLSINNDLQKLLQIGV
ncbi:unnamed protein product [Schistosoma margrebowiei]|uniref:Uncharacterized protein n=1 Tax=Schistosoma margrebowiei TaxID=48269 RepID=A0A183MGZ3_9TREM|nr:unnamed protein product [Schistosoma margrebowiei]